MLIRFRVTNFRSIYSEQSLELTADAKDKTNLEQKSFVSGKSIIPPILKTSAIFGANASGKSNIVKAIQLMRNIVIASPYAKKQGLFATSPFMLSDSASKEPTSFGVVVLIDNIIYDYKFSFNKERIVSEKIDAYVTSYPRTLFERTYDEKTDRYEYKFGQKFTGQKKIYEQTTRKDVLLLTNAVALNNEQLRPLYSWFKDSLIILNEHEVPNSNLILRYSENPEYKKELLSYLESADISIADFEVKKNDNNVLVPVFTHKYGDTKANLNFDDESMGTRALLLLSGIIFNSYSNPVTLIIDELERSLHPSIVEFIVRQFYNKNSCNNRSQLIFTSHCESLLCNVSKQHSRDSDDYSLFRRDQIWFVNKERDQSSKLVPLLDYKPRKHESVFDGYRQGRYSGIPIISKFELKNMIDLNLNNLDEDSY